MCRIRRSIRKSNKQAFVSNKKYEIIFNELQIIFNAIAKIQQNCLLEEIMSLKLPMPEYSKGIEISGTLDWLLVFSCRFRLDRNMPSKKSGKVIGDGISEIIEYRIFSG